MNVIFTCGGTAGHVNPAIALAERIKKDHPDARILFVGTPGGMEKKLIQKAGYDFRSVQISSFLRSFSLGGIQHNVKSVARLVTSRKEARIIIDDFHPDLVVGTGGYASYPVVKCASQQNIPTAVHESNMVPGLTTKLLEKYADYIMVGFEECRQFYKNPQKVIVTGTPVRGDFFELTHNEARKKLNITDEKPLIVSFWGSLGASTMNEHMVDFIRKEISDGYPFHHIHAFGVRGWEQWKDEMEKLNSKDKEYIDAREYIYDMATVMRAADLVICRAGASTISEITALGVPALIVPSPYVTNNHQEKNARILEAHGAAKLVLEKDSSGTILYESALEVLTNKELQEKMKKNMSELGIIDATERIYDTIVPASTKK